MAKGLMYISFWSYLLLAHVQAITATMRATGTVLWPTVILIATIWLIEVPAALLLSTLYATWHLWNMACLSNFIYRYI